MKSPRAIRILVVGWAVLMSHIGALSVCAAAEVAQTDQKVDPVAQTPAAGTLPTALLSLNASNAVFSAYAFLVDKRTRTLTVWQNEGDKIHLVGAWPADIGRNEGDKMSAGDAKTPEGIYFFQTSRDGRELDFRKYGVRVFTMDYPNYFDRLDGKTGNGIWLHAISDDQSLLRGSSGCVVVRNKVIEELGKFVELKRTPIVVVNTVEYLPEKEWLGQKARLMAWLNDWRAAWSGKDLDNYMGWYSERFQSMGMNKNKWRRYKQNLAGRYKYIEVGLRDVQIFNQGPKVVFRFLQEYKSDVKQDYGAKLIYAMKNGDKFEIVGETWESLRLPANADSSSNSAGGVKAAGQTASASGAATPAAN